MLVKHRPFHSVWNFFEVCKIKRNSSKFMKENQEVIIIREHIYWVTEQEQMAEINTSVKKIKNISSLFLYSPCFFILLRQFC